MKWRNASLCSPRTSVSAKLGVFGACIKSLGQEPSTQRGGFFGGQDEETAMHLTLNTPEIIGIAAVIIIGIAAIAFFALQRKRARTAALRRKFGPEYDWAMKKHGASGETVLLERQKRAEQIRLRDLDPGERARFLDQWKTVQASFVDS